MSKITIAQKAWMAGILEIRGRIRFTNGEGRKTNQLVLQVRSTQTAVIKRMCELTGTNIGTQEERQIQITNRRPCTKHCEEPHSHYSNVIGEAAVWAISGVGAAIVLHNLLPYFIEENAGGLNAVTANVLNDLPHEGRGRSAVDQTIIRLRGLGWEIPEAAMTHFVGTPVHRRQPVNA